MAARKPKGITDDIIVPVLKKVLKGKAKTKTLTKVATSAGKKSEKAGQKFDKYVDTKAFKGGPLSPPKRGDYIKVGPLGKRQLKKNYSYANLENAIIKNKSTKGVVKSGKKQAKTDSQWIQNPNRRKPAIEINR
jgi:hypothetical protein